MIAEPLRAAVFIAAQSSGEKLQAGNTELVDFRY